MPIWLVFATQVLVDIFHITRYQPGLALAEVRLTAAKHEKSLKAYCEFSKDKNDTDRDMYQSRDGSLTEKKYLAWMKKFIDEWVHEDRIGKIQGTMSSKYNRHPFWLLSYHPILCGAFVFSMNISMQALGRNIAQSWKMTQGALHIYNACAKMGPLSKPS